MRKKIARATMCCVAIFFCINAKGQEHWENVNGGLGSGNVNEFVTALLNDTTNHVLYAGGSFTTMNDTDGCDGFAIWNGDKWGINYQYFPGVINDITSLALYDNKVFVSGESGNVSYFVGNTWKLIGTFDNAINTLCVYRGKLYAGGKFTSVNGVAARKIACYDGAKWDSVGGGVYWSQACCSSVDAMSVWRGKLIVGGTFDRAVNPGGSEIYAGSIAAWNDTSWSAIGDLTNQASGVNRAYIYSVGTYKNDLIVGGGSLFTLAGGVAVRGIARYDGVSWHTLANGVNNEVHCMIVKDSNLYVGGSVYIGNTAYDSYGVLRWDGTNFNKIDSGLGNVNALAVYDNILYAGGRFNKKGMKNIARLLPDTIITGGATLAAASGHRLTVYPNPATDRLTVTALPAAAGSIEIQDLLGRTVQLHTALNPPTSTEIDISRLPPGMYLINIKTQAGSRITKFVKQ